MILMGHLNIIYTHSMKETPFYIYIYIYYTYFKGDLLHTIHVNVYEKPTFLKTPTCNVYMLVIARMIHYMVVPTYML